MVSVDLTAGTDLHSVDEFKQLAIKQKDGAIVRLRGRRQRRARRRELRLQRRRSAASCAVFIGIKVAPDANMLDVAKRVRDAMPDIQAQLPSGLTGEIVYDGTKFITASIHEVVKTLVEALLIVTIVIFLFLGSLRAVIIPVIAMPLSLIGTFFVMLALGYSINLLTLLALVLAIGLVVDDAIIVVENVDRHMKEEGKSPLQAALLAARELGGPILAMTVVLVAVYVPIGFQRGLTGALFTEFAFTLAGAVTVSAIIALTLSPMMCSRFFTQRAGKRPLRAGHRPRSSTACAAATSALLHGTLDTCSVVVVMGVLLFGATLLPGHDVASRSSRREEDQGFVLSISSRARRTRPRSRCWATRSRCSRSARRCRSTSRCSRSPRPGATRASAACCSSRGSERSRSAHAAAAGAAGRSGARSPAAQIFGVPAAARCPARRARRSRS